jgi:aromatic-L-amino-acid decarboxylase
MSLVCLRLKSGDEASKALLERVNESGEAFLSGNVLDGRFLLRIAIGNLWTQREDVWRTWAAVRGLAEKG